MIAFKGITHIIVALWIYFLAYGFDPYHMSAILVGSLIPDIDTRYSILGRYNIFSYFMKHRGVTHTLVGMAMFSWVIYRIFGDFVWGFVFGYAMHLLMDSLTPMGIMWLYPYKKDYYSVWIKKKKPS